MAKRTRGVGVRNTHRPGGHPPVRSASASASPRSSMGKAAEPPAAIPGEPLKTSTTDDPVASAIAATAVTSSPAAVAATSSTPAQARTPARSTPGRVKVKPDSMLAARAQDEYAYIRQDLRRISIVATSLFGILILLWLMFTIIDPFGLY